MWSRYPWAMMTLVRTVFVIVIAVSMATLPARLGAIGISAGPGNVVFSMADCASMGDTLCTFAPDMSMAAGDTMPMSSDCDPPGHDRTTLPGACSTYCNSLPLLPTIVSAAVDIVLADTAAAAIGAITVGIVIPPEPHPPKLA